MSAAVAANPEPTSRRGRNSTLDAESKRVVVTGLGALTCLGNDVPTCWSGLLEGRSGIGPITRFDADEFTTRIAGELKDFDPSPYLDSKQVNRLDAFCHYAVAASQQAVDQAGLDFAGDEQLQERTGILVSSGIGGIITFQAQSKRFEDRGPRRVSPFLIPMMISDMASGYLAIRYGCRGPNFGVVSACATGSHSLGEAWWMIKRGDADVMLAGGAEACISRIGIAGFAAMRALSTRNDEPTRASRPFERDRDGFVVGEGAGVVVLESLEHARARGADILAEMVGYGASADAYHFTQPTPDASGARRSIERSLAHNRIPVERVNYINAHGTSTPQNDKFETKAIRDALGAHAAQTPVSSTKSLTGHTLGAAGGIEAIVCVKAIQESCIPGTYNYDTPDPECDLDYVPNQSREQEVDVALSSNFGFGGHNATVAFSRFRN